MIDKKVMIGISIFLLFVCIASVSAEENVTQETLLEFQDVGNEKQKAVARRNQLNNISNNSKSNKRRKVHSKEKNR